MADLLKLLLPVFLSPTNYSEMLKKLASFLFYEVWIATFFLREIPSIQSSFQAIEALPAIKDITSLVPGHEKLNLTGLAIALVVAGVSYAIQLHDRISDLAGIRRRFDRKHILLPLARLVGVTLTERQANAVRGKRDELMHDVFYKYASSRADKPLVDKHDIERALDVWSWYWVLIEAMPVTLLCTAIAVYFEAYGQATAFSCAFVLLLVLTFLYSFRLKRFARPQISAIASDQLARDAVRARFDAI